MESRTAAVGDGPDAELTGEGGGGATARCALWWRRTPEDPEGGGRIGCVGRFECADVESGAKLLQRACHLLADEGCRRVAGPMDGDTWHAYRLVSAGWDRAARFFLEPWSPPEHIEAFVRAGFTPWARFSSSAFALVEPDAGERSRQQRLIDRLASRGVVIRGINADAFEDELGRLFELSTVAFVDNFLYTPISREAFLALYLPVREYVRGEFVLLAEKQGEPIGFVFAVPDVLAAEEPRTLR